MGDRSNSKLFVRTGWGLTALAVVAILASAALKISREAHNIEYITGKFGYPDGALVPIGVLELTCVLLYAWPTTSVLGAVLLTGYFGGAIATHVRISEVFITPLVLAMVAWLGLYLREPRLWGLLPLRKRN